MDKIAQAIELAMAEFKKEYGQDAKLEEGDSISTVFNDGVLVLGVEDNTLKVQVLMGEPYRVDADLM